MPIQRCCPEAPVYDRDLTDEATLFKALGDPARVAILATLARTDHEVCVCDFVEPLGKSQPTVSHHMKQLVDAGLVTREQRGKWAYYRVVDNTLSALSDALRSAR